jgi:basic membrane protein A and related proteins
MHEDSVKAKVRARVGVGVATLVVAALVAVLAVAAPVASGSNHAQLKVAWVTAGSVTASGWDKGGYAAFQQFAKTLNAKSSYLQLVNYDQTVQVLTRLAQAGNNIIITHSSGYEPGVLEVAAKFPKVWFLIYSDLSTTKGLKNVAGWKVNWNEHGYLQGAIACLASKTGKVGLVSSAPIPAFTRMAAGFKLATQQVGKCKGTAGAFGNSWTGSFTDVAKAKQAALALIGKGADVFSDGADAAGAGVVEAAKENGKLYVGGIADLHPTAPDIVVSSVYLNFKAAYADMAKKVKTKTLKAGVYDTNLENGGIKVTKFYVVPNAKSLQAQTAKIVANIKSGKIKISPTAEIKP